jgi:hypothetical protein
MSLTYEETPRPRAEPATYQQGKLIHRLSAFRLTAWSGPMGSRFSSIVGIVYIVIGLFVASGHAFFAHLNAVMPILSAILAVLLWPLVLLGVNLHLS